MGFPGRVDLLLLQLAKNPNAIVENNIFSLIFILVGVVVGNGKFILHCKNTTAHGATRCDRLAAMLKLYPDMQFYEYIG